MPTLACDNLQLVHEGHPEIQSPRARAGAMALTCALALVVTVGAGLAAEMFGNREAAAEQRARSRDGVVRSEILAAGFGPPASPVLAELSGRLASDRGVEILQAIRPFELSLEHGTLRGSPPSEAALAAATVLVFDELSLLPQELLRASGLRRVMLVADLSEERRPIPSLPNYRRSLLLDVHASPAFLRRLVHHELFHFLDLADDGEVLRDRAWEALNPPGFRYGPGGRAMREPGATAASDELAGFVSRYATSAVEEDKAELFSFLMTEPHAVRRRAADDPRLAAKVARLEHIVRSLGSDGSFWRRVERAR